LAQTGIALFFQSSSGSLIALDGGANGGQQFVREGQDVGFTALAKRQGRSLMRLAFVAVAVLFATATAQRDGGTSEEVEFECFVIDGRFCFHNLLALR
jgi:hypothetical protein